MGALVFQAAPQVMAPALKLIPTGGALVTPDSVTPAGALPTQGALANETGGKGGAAQAPLIQTPGQPPVLGNGGSTDPSLNAGEQAGIKKLFAPGGLLGPAVPEDTGGQAGVDAMNAAGLGSQSSGGLMSWLGSLFHGGA